MYDYYRVNKYDLGEVYPRIDMDSVENFLEEYEKFEEIDISKMNQIDELPEKIQKLMKQVYISKTLKNKAAIKARFKQYMKYNDMFLDIDIVDENVQEGEFQLDFLLLDLKSGMNFAAFIVEILDKKRLYNIKKNINNYNEAIRKLFKKNEKARKLDW